MYSEAYDTYDSTNHVLSFFADSALRKRAAEYIIASEPSRVIDIATGTGDTAIEIARLGKERGIVLEVIGLDANTEMLKVANDKLRKAKLDNIEFKVGNAFALKYKDGSFDAVTCSFAIKNFGDLDRFIGEAQRVLKKGGKLLIIDISKPDGSLNRAAFYVYLAYMKIVGAVAGKELYRWLPGSTNSFDRAAFVKMLRKRNFSEIKIKESFFGIAYILTCSNSSRN